MKKILTIGVVLFLVAVMAVVFSACGGQSDTPSTSAAPSVSNTVIGGDGSVTDQSNSGDNGAIGDAVSDISEGLTDLSERMAG